MVNFIKIAELPVAVSPLSGSEVAPIVQNGVTKQASVTDITTVVATNSNTPRTLADRFGEIGDVKNFGAVGNGITDDSAALISANLADNIFFSPGTYVVKSNITFTKPVVFSAGAIIDIANGVTVAFNKGFSAGVYKVFNINGTAQVTFNSQYITVGYPEWWGAITNVASDSTDAIKACFAALSITELQPADYYIATTLVLNVAGRTLRGAGPFYNGVTGDSTRIISLTGSNNVIQVGPNSAPATINDHTHGITLENFQVSRAAAPNIASGCCGILSRWTLYQNISNVKSVESIISFQYQGTVACYTANCWAFRSVAGSGGGSDYWYGFYVNGATKTIAASGGNASIYFSDTNSNIPPGIITNSNGFYIDGDWADTSLTNPEVTGASIGIRLAGNGSTTFGFGETDLNIVKPIIDAFSIAGIYISGLSQYGAVSITGGFAAPYGTGTPTACIYLNNCAGHTGIANFQHICGSNTSMTGGLVAIDSKNISSACNVYSEAYGYSIALSNVSLSLFADDAISFNANTGAVIYMTNSARNKFEMSCDGASNKFSIGYNAAGTSNQYNEFNCTGLNPSAISGGSGNKLTINGVQVTTTGLSGTNLVSGVMN